MTRQTRQAVFETNSSSSHSLTIGAGEVKPSSLPLKTLKSGVLDVYVDRDYRWEWERFHTPERKFAYLVTQKIAAGGRGPDPDAREISEALADEDPEISAVFHAFKEETGCDVRVHLVWDEPCVDHDSEGLGSELWRDPKKMVAFLLDDSAFIELGNDNDRPPEMMPTDRGAPEETYAYQVVDELRGDTAFSISTGRWDDPMIIIDHKGVRHEITHGSLMTIAKAFENAVVTGAHVKLCHERGQTVSCNERYKEAGFLASQARRAVHLAVEEVEKSDERSPDRLAVLKGAEVTHDFYPDVGSYEGTLGLRLDLTAPSEVVRAVVSRAREKDAMIRERRRKAAEERAAEDARGAEQ